MMHRLILIIRNSCNNLHAEAVTIGSNWPCWRWICMWRCVWRWRSAVAPQRSCLLAASNYRPLHTGPNSMSRSVGRQSPTECSKSAIHSPRRCSLQQRHKNFLRDHFYRAINQSIKFFHNDLSGNRHCTRATEKVILGKVQVRRNKTGEVQDAV